MSVVSFDFPYVLTFSPGFRRMEVAGLVIKWENFLLGFRERDVVRVRRSRNSGRREYL